jgi:hypothetical protein
MFDSFLNKEDKMICINIHEYIFHVRDLNSISVFLCTVSVITESHNMEDSPKFKQSEL